MDNNIRVVQFWLKFMCKDAFELTVKFNKEIEFIDEKDFKEKLDSHVKYLADKGIEIGGVKW